MMKGNTHSGFALSIVLWIIAVLLLGIAYISSLSKENLKMSAMLQDKLATRIMAKNYYEALKYYVATANYDSQKLSNRVKEPRLPDEIYLDGRHYRIGNVTISLQDFSGMIHPYKLSSVLADHSQRELRLSINDSLADWLDTDNIVRLNGAESAYYQLQKQLSYKPANMPFIQSIDELRLIKGIRDIPQQTWQQIKNTMTYQNGPINIMLVNAVYLSALLGISRSEAEALVKLRENNSHDFFSAVRENKNYDDETIGRWISKKIKLTVIAEKNQAKTILEVILDYHAVNQKLFTIESYKIY